MQTIKKELTMESSLEMMESLEGDIIQGSFALGVGMASKSPTDSKILRKDASGHQMMAVFCSTFSKTEERSLHFGNIYKHSTSQELFS